MAAGVVFLVTAVSGGVAAARTSTHCPKMPGLIVAANSSLEVSRSQVAFHTYGADGGDVYRACVRRGGSYSEHFLLAPGVGGSATVKVAGGYVAVHTRWPAGQQSLDQFDPGWGADASPGGQGTECPNFDAVSGTCPGSPLGIRGFALDRLGRLAWIESYTSGGNRWVRLRVRTQAGITRTVAHRRGLNSIARVRITRDGVHWSADGRVHTTNVERPQCQIVLDPERVLDPGMARVLARSRDVLVAERTDDVISGCLRSDGHWRQLLVTNTQSSHGDALTNVLTAGAWIVLNHARYPEGDGAFMVVDLRSGRWDQRDTGWPSGSVDALAPNGRYVFHSSPYPPVSTQLYAARPGKPDVQIDEGGPSFRQDQGPVQVFTDVQIQSGRASWKNAGIARSAPLP